VGYPPDASRVPESWWEEHRARIAAALAVALVDVYLEAAAAVQAGLPGSVSDWAQVQGDAATWARDYAGGLAASLVTNTRSALAALLSLAPGMSAEDVTRRVRDLFGPTRAATIAITETTRAVSAAERHVIDLVAVVISATLTPYYQTAADERVCPMCSPRNRRRITDGVFPPLHPRCRCWVDWQLEVSA